MAFTNHLPFHFYISSTKSFIFPSFSTTLKPLPSIYSASPFKPSPKISKSDNRTTVTITAQLFNAKFKGFEYECYWHRIRNTLWVLKIHCQLRAKTCFLGARVNDVATSEKEVQADMEVAEGYSLSQFCDKIIDIFMNEKPKTKEWRKFLVFREEWKKYRESFYSHCQRRADWESDPIMKEKLISLGRKVKKIDDEMEIHSELLKELQDSPTDINAIVAKRRKEFTDEFFKFLTLISETHDSLEDRDAVARLAARCLAAVSAYDRTLENVETLDFAQAKFDNILNSSSLDVACEKIASLAKAKELDSSLILLINSAWASAKESTTMKNEVKEIMYHLYKATKSSLRSMAPKEIKLLKHLLNIVDPEERFSALATAFSPGDGSEQKDPNALYTTPKELHKWIKIMLDSYHLNQEDTDIREARNMTQPIVIQRLFILKDTIETEYLEQNQFQNPQSRPDHNHSSEDAISI